jgi:hypothetical protein
MVAYTDSNLKKWIAPAGGLIAGGMAVVAALVIPTPTLEDLVWNSGIAAILPVAQPPLGNTARAILALSWGLMAAAIAWSGLYLLFEPGGTLEKMIARRADSANQSDAAVSKVKSVTTERDGVRQERKDRLPTIRRADAHPDAPARRPLSAADLGTPMPPSQPQRKAEPAIVERDIPADLDQPLAAFDPQAVPAEPRQPVRPVAPLRAPALAKGERIDTVELPHRPGEDTPSIESLLRRLEQGTRRPQRVATR